MARTCLERYDRIISLIRKMAAICGADFVKENFRVTAHTWFTIVAINSFLSFSFYTVYYALAIEGDWKIMLIALSMVGSCLQGYSKLLSAIFMRPALIILLTKLRSIYEEYEVDIDYWQVLKNHVDITKKMLKAVLVMYVITIGGVIVYPLIYGGIRGEKMLIVQFYLPGVNHETTNGYLCHVVFHGMCCALGGFGNYAGDMFIFVIITHIPLLKDVFAVKCLKLNRLIEEKGDPEKTLPALKDVLQWHQQYNTFIRRAESVCYAVVFVQIFTSSMNICLTLFCMIIGSWPAAFFFLIYCYIMLISYCGLGNLVEKSNDEITNIIYGSILWYKLSVKEQKLILLMLRKSQNSIQLSVGNVMALSMETALQLTKAIYSYMMMLVNFLEMDDL